MQHSFCQTEYHGQCNLDFFDMGYLFDMDFYKYCQCKPIWWDSLGLSYIQALVFQQLKQHCYN